MSFLSETGFLSNVVYSAGGDGVHHASKVYVKNK